MKYLFDTDHFSILQRKAGIEYQRLSNWMAQFTPADFACCVVGLHEQVIGAHAFLNQAKNTASLMRGYVLLERLPRGVIYDQLRSQNLGVGTMDLRLSSIALAHKLKVLSRNLRDFSRVPGLVVEDRTV